MSLRKNTPAENEKLREAREVRDALRDKPKNQVFTRDKTSRDTQAERLMRQHFDGKMSAREVESKLKALGLTGASPYSDSKPLGQYQYKDIKTGSVTIVPKFKKQKPKPKSRGAGRGADSDGVHQIFEGPKVVKPEKEFRKGGKVESLNQAIDRVKKEQGFRNGGKVSLGNFKGSF